MRKDKAFKTHESQKSTMQKLAQGLPECLQGRRRFWSKDPTFPNSPQFHHFHSSITAELSDSVDGGRNKVWWQLCVCVTELAIWEVEMMEALLPCALSGRERAYSEHRHHQRLSSTPAPSPSPTLLCPTEMALRGIWGAYQEYSSPHKKPFRKSQ